MRKVLIVLTGIIFFYIVRVFFKRLKKHTMQSGNGNVSRENNNTGSRVDTGKSYLSDRVIEDAEYVEISGDPAK